MLNVLDRRGAPDPTSDLPRPDLAGDEPLTVVRDLIARVRSEGDAALIELTARFDGAQLEALRVSDEQIDRAWEATDPAVRGALQRAVDSVAAYHRHQLRAPSEFVNPTTGVRIMSSYSPVTRAGCYVPGGRAAYPSTVIHTVVPALVAGVDQVAVCVPPAGPDGVT
ncbi:MAG: histidinol dehydrogenase, partial [Candidatus Microthrix subdominans]